MSAILHIKIIVSAMLAMWATRKFAYMFMSERAVVIGTYLYAIAMTTLVLVLAHGIWQIPSHW